MNDPHDSAAHVNHILDELQDSAEPDALAWLREGIGLLRGDGPGEDRLADHFAAALRRLGSEPLTNRSLRLATPCGEVELGAWSRGDAGRVCLLLTAVADAPPGWEALVRGLFRHGDENERASLARALCLMPAPCALPDLAREVGRANSLRLYAALALDNPYPSACFDDHAFNQVVLKSLFNGLPVHRIVGLTDRANPELSRMCEQYRDERAAAGRSIPTDLWLALEPHASTRGLELILEALNDGQPEHRYNAIVALNRRRSEPRIAQALADHLARETVPELRRLLESTVV